MPVFSDNNGHETVGATAQPRPYGAKSNKICMTGWLPAVLSDQNLGELHSIELSHIA